VRSVLLACLVVIVGGAAWLLVNDPASPGPVDRTKRRVTTVVARDSSGNGHHAIIQGPVQLGRPGLYGSSFSFDNAGSWLMVPPSPDLNPGDRDFLVSAWIYLRANLGPGETYDVVRKGISYTDPGEFKLEVLQHGRVRCTAKDDKDRTARVTTSDVDVLDGRWHLIGCARTGRRWSVLVDDTLTSRFIDLGRVENDMALSIGSKYGLEDQPDGRLDDVKLVLGRPHYQDTGDHLTRLEALEQRAPTARWRMDEPPARDASAP
jgi:Concanavalin A-like lectin/glucanases superfamily